MVSAITGLQLVKILIVFTICSQINGQQQQQQHVVQPTSDVTPDRAATLTYVAPAYDYTYLTKPYGYSAYRNYDTSGLNSSPYSYNGGYGTANYGGGSGGLLSSIWPLILLPFLIFVGLSIFFPLVVQMPNQWGSRQSPSEPTDEASFILQSVLRALENNECLHRTACDLGLYARHLGTTKGKVLGFVEKFAPPKVSPYLEILRDAATHVGDTRDFCEKYTCTPDRTETFPPQERQKSSSDS